MFGNMFGDLEGKQAEMQEKLNDISLNGEAGDGAVLIEMTAAKRVTNVEISENLLSSERKEELEDLILSALDAVLQKVALKEKELSEDMIKNMIPGLGGLGDLF